MGFKLSDCRPNLSLKYSQTSQKLFIDHNHCWQVIYRYMNQFIRSCPTEEEWRPYECLYCVVYKGIYLQEGWAPLSLVNSCSPINCMVYVHCTRGIHWDVQEPFVWLTVISMVHSSITIANAEISPQSNLNTQIWQNMKWTNQTCANFQKRFCTHGMNDQTRLLYFTVGFNAIENFTDEGIWTHANVG